MNTKKFWASLHALVHKFNGDKTVFDLRSYKKVVLKIRENELLLELKSEAELKQLGEYLKQQVRKGILLTDVLPEVYSLVNEVFKRKMQIFPFDVQLIGAIALNDGNIIEMQTGEGKTLTAVFPAILNAMCGKGVHILTYNDYLARRDANWMKPIYGFFDLTVGCFSNSSSMEDKINAFNADLTYCTAKEMGFSYLRSCMAYEEHEIIIRDFNFAIVDEADAIMVDEARNPLVLAGTTMNSHIDPYGIANFVSGLEKHRHYCLDEYSRNVFLTASGIESVEKVFNLDNLFEEANTELHSSINLALQAKVLLHKDIDYVIRYKQIKLIDELTGRIVEDRKWQNGLQTAVEAKENLPIQSDGNILGSISIQHLIQLYPKRAGMTGTAQQASEEFSGIYNLGVVVIPPNRPCVRKDDEDRVYSTKKAKTRALLEEIKAIHREKRPILIGTLTVKESEELKNELLKNQIKCNVLNAKNDEEEAKIISGAGKLGAITISTNMAGRGTDILLGGQDEEERATVKSLGGLHVIGTNRHESTRIDNQLRGRAGRQGDPGSSRFIISLEDELMVKYKLEELLPKKLRVVGQSMVLKNRIYHQTIAQAQRIISAQMFAIRHSLFEYTFFIEQQRKVILSRRKEVLLKRNNFAPIKGLNNGLQHKVREFILNQYDVHWALHLDHLVQLREGIYWERVGGNDPLRIFFIKSDENFHKMMAEIDRKIQKIPDFVLSPDLLKIKRPASTWTYIINDNPFTNKLGVFLVANSNIGFQIDVLTAPILFLSGVLRKLFKK